MFCIEGPILENDGSSPYGWNYHVVLTMKNLYELMELKYAPRFGF